MEIKKYNTKYDSSVAALFDGWQETMLWSCLGGYMGTMTVNNREKPTAAMITAGDFCFLAGQPDVEIIRKITAPIITPRDAAWERAIEETLGDSVERGVRYSIKKEPDVFDRERLERFVKQLSAEFEIKQIDRELYEYAMNNDWSRDFCSLFEDCDDYLSRGLGFCALYCGTPVSGASSYSVYDGGIEIEIDTCRDFRNRGLATACGARLILECLDCGLYPSWDAHDLRSVALAEKLGYHRNAPYTVYYVN